MKGKPFTSEERQYMTEHYADISSEKIAKHLNRTLKSVYAYAAANGFKKSKEYLASPECGIFTKGMVKDNGMRFKKGQSPPNKGVKMTPELKEKCKHTFFKKGNLPKNTMHDGDLVIRKDKRANISYILQRVSKGKWVGLHKLKWEEKHGPVPKGFNVIFKDGDHANFDDDNLILVSNRELLDMNTLHRFPQDLKNLIYAKGALSRQINKQNKDGQTNS